jgi:hypothetical protein
MRKTDFMLEMDVGGRGAGIVEKSIVASTMTRKQARNFLQQKTIMMPFVVEEKKDLRKMNIVVEGVQDIVGTVGKLVIVYIGRTHRVCRSRQRWKF